MYQPTSAVPGRGCPRCAEPSPLVADESPGDWTCKRCGGHYLDGPATRALVVTELGVAEDVLRGLPALDGGGRPVPCPCGAADAASCVLRSVAVNLCPACAGLWLDPGELLRLSAGQRGTPASGRHGARLRLRLEQDSAREWILLLLTVMGLAVLIVALLFEWNEPSLDVAPFALGGLVAFAIGLYLRGTTDDHAYIDPSQRALILHRRFLGSVRREVACHAAQAKCTTTTARYSAGAMGGSFGRRGRWAHQAVLVRQDGREFALSSRSVSFTQADEVAREAAEVLGVPHVPGVKKGPLVVRRAAAGVAVSHGSSIRHWLTVIGIRLAGAVVAVAVVVGGVHFHLGLGLTMILVLLVLLPTLLLS